MKSVGIPILSLCPTIIISRTSTIVGLSASLSVSTMFEHQQVSVFLGHYLGVYRLSTFSVAVEPLVKSFVQESTATKRISTAK